jgi:tetratricopeptide (TPR) repeat protein
MRTDASPPALAAPPRSRRWVAGAAVGLFAVAVGAAAYWWPRPKPAVVPVANRTDDDDWNEPATVANPGYVGMQACAKCHAKRVAEFPKTKHFKACREPEPGMMAPGFAPDKGAFTVRDPDIQFEMTQRGNDFFQANTRDTPDGRRRSESKVGLVYGSSGAADEMYFAWHGDALFELPVAWLYPLGRWGIEPFNPFGNADMSRTVTTRCLECHNTWIEHVRGSENKYVRDHMHLGVTCEKCHGPGREHAEYHIANPQAAEAHAIVHPGTLSRDRLMDVCGQCHSNANKPLGPAFTYRPGEPLAAHFRTSVVKYPEMDHVIDQGKYLRQSKCFQKSEMTCVTCHDPHKPTAPGAGQKSCQQCHQPADCHEQPKLPAAVRGDCVGCHMPKYNRIQVHFHTEDDRFVPPVRPKSHKIQISPTATQEVLLAWHKTQPGEASRAEAAQLTTALADHWQAEADAMRRAARYAAALAALREVLRLDPTPARRAQFDEVADVEMKLRTDYLTAQRQRDAGAFPAAIKTLKHMLEVKPDHAAAHGLLGALYAATGEKALAVKHLNEVAVCDPDDPYGFAMLGWLAYLDGRPDDALVALRKADAIEPYSAKLQFHMGLALAKKQDWPGAIAAYRRALDIDPNHAAAWQGLGVALRRQDQTAEGLRAARRAAKLSDNQNADILMSLADAFADASRFDDARATAVRAADVAKKASPELVPQLLRRAEEFRLRAKAAPK